MDKVTDLPACVRCGWKDEKNVGDWDCMVARCSHCDEMVCGKCWDEYHSDSCGGED